MEINNTLGRCPLFERLDPEHLANLARACRLVTVRAGESLFHEGQTCEGFYVVTQGSVRIYKLASDGRQRILHIVRAPHAFAEAALFGMDTYPAFASAIEKSCLVFVPREPFIKMLREQPDVSLHVFESLSQWMHRLLDQLENETFLNARAKLASYILREIQRQAAGPNRSSIQLTQPKKEIAAQLGMAAETFSRAQADLESRGVIHVTGRRIAVSDLEVLQNVIFGDSDPE